MWEKRALYYLAEIMALLVALATITMRSSTQSELPLLRLNLGWLAYCDHANARWYGLAVVICAVPSVGALALRSLLYK